MPSISPRVKVAPAVIRWAINYSRREDYLRGKYLNLAGWESGTVLPTLKQLQDFAKDARVAEGWMFCSEPPDIKPDIPDMRTVGNAPVSDPSPDLIDTLFACQRRQDWFAGFAEAGGLSELEFVGSLTTSTPPSRAAASMRDHLQFDAAQRVAIGRGTYRSTLVRNAERLGVLVMINGIVGNNPYRKLDPGEFRGFAISHSLAPLTFVNSNDSLGAQIFTLAHELAHLWLGLSGVSAPDSPFEPSHPAEVWCNAVAAEFLVPEPEMRKLIGRSQPIETLDELSLHFKVSNQVILRRLRLVGLIERNEFQIEYQKAVKQARQAGKQAATGGGDFYNTLPSRVSRTFAETLYLDTHYGNTSPSEAYRLLGISSDETFDRLGRKLGVEL